jgi:hypothetical protein
VLSFNFAVIKHLFQNAGSQHRNNGLLGLDFLAIFANFLRLLNFFLLGIGFGFESKDLTLAITCQPFRQSLRQ